MLPLMPVPSLRLPEWSAGVRRSWEANGDRAAALGRGAGSGRNFDQLLVEVRHLLGAGDSAPLIGRLGDRRFVRAVITVWLDDEPLARSTMSRELLAVMTERASVSRLATIRAAELFLEHFDRLDGWGEGLFVAVRDLVRRAVASQRMGKTGDVVETLREQDGYLLEPDGPMRLAGTLLASGGDVAAWFRGEHLTAYSDSRFGRVARDAFYLTAIEAADAEHGDHGFLGEVTSEVRIREKSDASEADRFSFGHQVLSALTGKTTRHPSTDWLRAALDIGGDPRLSQTPAWRMWWSKVPDENRARAVRWMRGVDLHAFLDGVEQYANATYNTAMQRMLERRKRLLLGLYEQDRIEDVRLILGDDIRSWIRRSARLSLVDEARLADPGKSDTAVIFVDCGDFSLVEGSHNFKLHIYLGRPNSRLADRRVTGFGGVDLRETFPRRHAEANGSDSYLAVAHLGGEWIRTALDFLRDSGITIDERGLMTPNDYADLSRRRAGWWS